MASQKLNLRSVSPSFTVSDVEKSLAWYRDVLGFTVGERWEEKGALLGVELNAGNVTFMISQDDWRAKLVPRTVAIGKLRNYRFH